MKRLTYIAFGITGIGFLISFINSTSINLRILDNLGLIIISLGITLIYIFFTAWQAEISKSRLIITLSVSSVFILMLATFAFIADIDAERSKAQAVEILMEYQENSDEAMQEIMALEVELEKCREEDKTKNPDIKRYQGFGSGR